MADTFDVITAAIANAEEGVDDGGAPESVDTSVGETSAAVVETPAAVVETPVEKPADGVAVPDPKTKTDEVDEVATLLEAEGFVAGEKGQRENRMPYSRVKKVVENARTKLVTAHTAELTQRDTELTAVKAERDNFQRAHALAETNPEQYILALAALNPEYRKYLPGATTPTTTVTTPGKVEPPADDPMPTPDGKYPDGTAGYTEEGYTKLRAWDRRQATREAMTEAQKLIDARLGPLEGEKKSAAELQQREASINRQVAQVNEAWGEELVKANETEIGKVIEENLRAHAASVRAHKMNPQVAIVPVISIADAAAKILVPKTRVNRDTMRAELLKEINARPGAAQTTVPGATTVSTKESTGPKTTEDVIRDSLAAAGLKA